MKKRFLCLIIAICLIIPCFCVLTGCKPITTFRMSVRLNHKDATYTEEFKERKGYSSNNVTHIINPNNYDNFVANIATKDDIVAPAGKTFAGWYFNDTCTADQILNKTNWDAYVKARAEQKSGSIYAHWVNDTDVSVYFDLNAYGATYKDSYKTELGIAHDAVRFVGAPETVLAQNLPTESDINKPENKVFLGWFLDKLYTKEVNETNLLEAKANSALITIYAGWKDRVEVSNIFYTHNDNIADSFMKSFIFDESVEQIPNIDFSRNFMGEVSLKTFKDEGFAGVQAVANILAEKITQPHGTTYAFAGWKIYKWVEGTPQEVDFNEANWEELTDVPLLQTTTSIGIYATWDIEEAE